MMYGYGVSHGLGFVGEIFSLVFWAAIIWLIIGLVRGGHHHGKGCCGGHGDEQRPDSATEILRQRFAKGEISKEEFESRIAVLEGKKVEKS